MTDLQLIWEINPSRRLGVISHFKREYITAAHCGRIRRSVEAGVQHR